MLFLGKEQITPKQFGELFGLSKQVEKVINRPIFKIHKDRINKDLRGNIKRNEGFSVPTKMWLRIPDGKSFGRYKAGEKVEFRYAQAVVPERQKDGSYVDRFKPKMVRLRGDAFPNKSYTDHQDLAWFMYCSFEHKGSPFRTKGLAYKNYYIHNDPTSEAAHQINEFSKLKAALAHAETASVVDLLTMANGLRRAGHKIEIIDERNESSVRAGMMAFAANPKTAGKYYEPIEDKVLHVKGKIVSLIDRGILQLSKKGGGRQWEWSSGEKQGEPVGALIHSHGSDARAFVINHIISNLDQYNHLLDEAVSGIRADDSARNFFEANKEQTEPEQVNAEVPEYLLTAASSGPKEPLPNPENNEDVKAFVEKRGYKKHPDKVAAFRNAIREGEVTDATADIYLKELYA